MTESPGALFEQLLAVMQRLRAPGGCPWDRAQTPGSLKPFLLEEAYEVLEAIDRGEATSLREELGDLLFQVVFHAQLAREDGAFTMADVVGGLIDKMQRRHPHVFGDATVETPAEALAQWEVIKQREGRPDGQARSVIDGVPRALPSLLRAQRFQSKAARVRFDWPDAQAAWAKVEEEMQEAARAIGEGGARLHEELGDVLFSLVNVARLSGLDAEAALDGAVEKFRRRFVQMERDLSARGVPLGTASAPQMEEAWEAVKAAERSS
jgi:MazG family protein